VSGKEKITVAVTVSTTKLFLLKLVFNVRAHPGKLGKWGSMNLFLFTHTDRSPLESKQKEAIFSVHLNRQECSGGSEL
jgi:hypothetical protein